MAAGFALVAAPAFADFQTLPTSGDLRVVGLTDESPVDNLLVPYGAPTGEITGPNGAPGQAYAFPNPGTWVPISQVRETAIMLPDEDDGELEEVGTFFDSVYRDTSDGSLLFVSQIILEEEGEINDIFRSGFTGYSVAAGWTFSTDFDLRMYSAARTASGLGDPDVFDPDVVDMRTDLNVEEENPWSGWFFLKVAAPGYQLGPNAIQLLQAGEEDQTPFPFVLDGYIPTPVPEPSTYAMLLGGLGLLGLMARRRARSKQV